MFRPRFLVVPLVMKAHFLLHALSFSRACALKLSWLSRSEVKKGFKQETRFLPCKRRGEIHVSVMGRLM